MGDDLFNAVTASIKSDVPCPYLLHYRPKTITKQMKKGKPHHFALTPDHLTKQFAKYRKLSGAYKEIPNGQKPSFNDLRPFGVSKYMEAGYSKKYIKALTGHSTEEMVEYYNEGHAPIQPEIVHAELKR